MRAKNSSEMQAIDFLEQNTVVRWRVITALQIMGTISLVTSGAIYRAEMQYELTFWICCGFALTIGVGFLVLASYNAVTGFLSRWILLEKSLNPNPVEIDGVVTIFSVGIMTIDAILVAIIVSTSGGPFESPFSPLLFAILSTAVLLRLPPASFICSIVLTGVTIMVVVFLKVAEIEPKIDVLVTTQPSSIQAFHYHVALFINTMTALALTIVGGYEQFRNKLPWKEINHATQTFNEMLHTRTAYEEALRRGIKKCSRDVGYKAENITLSKVHDLGSIIEQAIVLSLPYSRSRYAAETRASIVYLTFVSHWFDDFCDSIYVKCANVPHNPISAESFCSTSRHLRKLRASVRRRLHIGDTIISNLLLWRYDQFDLPDFRLSSRHTNAQISAISIRGAIVDRALERIILAGMMQQCDLGGDPSHLLQEYLRVVEFEGDLDRRICEVYRSLFNNSEYWIIIWGTGKCVLELFDSMSETFNLTCSELYNLLYTPMLVLQNAEAEARYETPSENFKNQIFNMEPANSADLVTRLRYCLQCFRENADLLTLEGPLMIIERHRQLEAILALYRNKLPSELIADYLAILDDRTIWSVKEQLAT